MNRSSFEADFLRLLLTIAVPPLRMFLQEGLEKHFWINVVLTFFGYVPGLIHAVWRTDPFGRA
jgi:uncharacterized membrane protein YqaE (UPF0057 family)